MKDQEIAALISQLKTVQAPGVSAVPAMGWWLALLALCLLLSVAYWLFKRYRKRQWLRDAKTEITQLREQLERQPANKTLAGASRLARQLLLVAKPRQDVANLHGQAWLQALDDICTQPLFVKGAGRLLASSPYQRDPQVDATDLESLLDAMDELIKGAARNAQQRAL